VGAFHTYDRVETIGFAYGQRHAVEMSQRPILRSVIAGLKPGLGRAAWGDVVVVDLSGYGALAESALTADRAIEMTASGLPSTFVPGAQSRLLSQSPPPTPIAAAPRTLVGGMCETDYSGYPDCRRETIDAMEQALSLGLASPLKIETPLMHLTKAETWALAHQLGGAALVEAILEHSHTCYEGDRATVMIGAMAAAFVQRAIFAPTAGANGARQRGAGFRQSKKSAPGRAMANGERGHEARPSARRLSRGGDVGVGYFHGELTDRSGALRSTSWPRPGRSRNYGCSGGA
jgi:7-cyano-7-deazaguanine synthase